MTIKLALGVVISEIYIKNEIATKLAKRTDTAYIL